jgi:hypothetical protein
MVKRGPPDASIYGVFHPFQVNFALKIKRAILRKPLKKASFSTSAVLCNNAYALLFRHQILAKRSERSVGAIADCRRNEGAQIDEGIDVLVQLSPPERKVTTLGSSSLRRMMLTSIRLRRDAWSLRCAPRSPKKTVVSHQADRVDSK